MEENPCRAGIAASPAEYRWSSAAAHLLGARDRSGVLDLGFWQRAGGAATWAELLSGHSSADQITALRKCTYSGRPLGEEQFVSAMEERFPRKWRRATESMVKIAKTA